MADGELGEAVQLVQDADTDHIEALVRNFSMSRQPRSDPMVRRELQADLKIDKLALTERMNVLVQIIQETILPLAHR